MIVSPNSSITKILEPAPKAKPPGALVPIPLDVPTESEGITIANKVMKWLEGWFKHLFDHARAVEETRKKDTVVVVGNIVEAIKTLKPGARTGWTFTPIYDKAGRITSVHAEPDDE